jgi:tRNA-uridine 2-sulfurtransferase
VIRLDAAGKRVIVGPREALRQTDIAVKDLNWLGAVPLSEQPQPCYARIRSTRPPVAASVRRGVSDYVVTIPDGEYGVSPGQACVLYDAPGPGQKVLGGGFIAGQPVL